MLAHLLTHTNDNALHKAKEEIIKEIEQACNDEEVDHELQQSLKRNLKSLVDDIESINYEPQYNDAGIIGSSYSIKFHSGLETSSHHVGISHLLHP